MKVELLNYTPLIIADKSISKCWDKGSDNVEPNKERMLRVANKNKHKSTIEHVVYNFDIDGISRACLQELSRHRIASLSVKSSRYTLHELKGAELHCDKHYEHYIHMTGNAVVDKASKQALANLQDLVQLGMSNDEIKYAMPECYLTSLVWTINMRSLQNFLELRSSKSALKEIRDLAKAIYEEIPEEHKFMFEYIYEKEEK